MGKNIVTEEDIIAFLNNVMEEFIATWFMNEFFESFKPIYYKHCNDLINKPEYESVKKILGVEVWEDILPLEQYDKKMLKYKHGDCST